MKRLLLPLALLVAACADDDAERRPSALLITLDTTRADVVGAPGVTPRLDELARSSVRFDAARTVTPLTLPSHCSMLTGLYPPRHTVRVNSVQPLPSEAETVAERARAAGHQTAAIVASIALDASFGTAQGFETFEQPDPPDLFSERRYDELPATEITDRALAWLARRDPDRPFLLWVHYFDPHIPLKAPAAHTAGRTPYEAEVAYMDAEIGRLLDGLRERGLLDSTLVAVVADHGESNGDHGEATHGAFCYDSTMRVPFLLRHPDGRGAGEHVDVPVSVADVHPTLIDFLGLGSPGDVDGRSLLDHRALEDTGVYLESHYGNLLYGWSPMAGWVRGDTKLVQSASPELFDLSRDPGETTNLLPASEALAEALRRPLAELLARPALEPGGESVDPAMLERLMSLGYTAGSEGSLDDLDPFAPDAGLAPHARADELQRFHRAQALSASGRHAEAIELFEPLVRENPRNASALYELGMLYGMDQSGANDGRAIQLLLRNLELAREWYGPHFYLGQAYRRQGALEAAERHLRAAVRLNPRLYQAMGLLSVTLLQRGQREEALEWKRKAETLASRMGAPIPGGTPER